MIGSLDYGVSSFELLPLNTIHVIADITYEFTFTAEMFTTGGTFSATHVIGLSSDGDVDNPNNELITSSQGSTSDDGALVTGKLFFELISGRSFPAWLTWTL